MESLYIIIVEDERETLNNVIAGLRKWLSMKHPDIASEVLDAASFEDVERRLARNTAFRSALFDKSGKRVCAVLDNKLEGSSKSGVEIAEWLRATAPDTKIIGYSSYHSKQENYKKFMEHGALVLDKDKPANDFNELIARIDGWMREHAGVKDDIEEYLRRRLGACSSVCDELIKKTALNVRTTKPAGIIFGGHLGCGKNYLADIVHEAAVEFGYRKPKIRLVNITTESQSQHTRIALFGIKKGPHIQQQEGAFRETEDGTLIIDEIGNCPRAVQTQLLTAIDPGKFTPEHSSTPLKANSWVIMTTSRPEKIIPELRDRFSLIMMPSVTERQQDIPLIIEYFLKEQSKHHGCSFSLGMGAKQLLESQAWQSFREIRDTLVYTCENKVNKTPGSKQIGPDEIIWELSRTEDEKDIPRAETVVTTTACFYETPSGIILDPRISVEIAQTAMEYIRDRWLDKAPKETPGQLRSRDSTLAAAVYLHFFAQLWPARQDSQQTLEHYAKVFVSGKQKSENPHRNLAKDARQVIRLRNTSKPISQSLIQDEIAPAFVCWCQENGLVWPEDVAIRSRNKS